MAKRGSSQSSRSAARLPSVSAEVPQELKDEITKAAAEEERSEAWIVREALRWWLDNRKSTKSGLFPGR